MKVLGIMGRAGAGKDSVGQFLAEHYGYQVFGFSWPLKTLVAEAFDLDRSRMDELEYKESIVPGTFAPDGSPRTLRQILQIIGTEGFRAVDPNYWVKRTLTEIELMLSLPETQGVVITDLRFVNEAEAIRAHPLGEIWAVRKIGGSGTSSTMHASETELHSITPDAVLTAKHGRIEDLYWQAEQLMSGN